MSEIRFRLAKPSDAKEIANIHWHVRERYTQGIFLSLGESFLRAFIKSSLMIHGKSRYVQLMRKEKSWGLQILLWMLRNKLRT